MAQIPDLAENLLLAAGFWVPDYAKKKNSSWIVYMAKTICIKLGLPYDVKTVKIIASKKMANYSTIVMNDEVIMYVPRTFGGLNDIMEKTFNQIYEDPAINFQDTQGNSRALNELINNNDDDGIFKIFGSDFSLIPDDIPLLGWL